MKTILVHLLILMPSFLWAQTIDSSVIRQVDSLIQISRDLTEQSDFDQALIVNAAAENIALEKLGKESAAYGSCCFNRGRVLYFNRDYPNAEKWYLKSISIREKALGKEHPDYAQSLHNLAILYVNIGKYKKAEPLYIESKAVREKALGKEHPDYAQSLNNLAILYVNMGKYEKAEPLYLESKAVREKALGKEHPDYAQSLNNLAILYVELRQYEKAEPLYLESKAVREKALGKEHPDYAASLNNLALMYKILRQYEKAEPLYLESKAVREKALGKEHPDYAASLNNLAGLYWGMGKYEKAESLYLECIAIRGKALGKEHPDYAQSLSNLAALYMIMGQYEKAEPISLEATAIQEKTLGKEHIHYSTGLLYRAYMYRQMGQYEKALPLYHESNTIFEKTLGKEHPNYANSLIGLAYMYLEMGNNDKAEPFLLESLTIREKTLGREHPDYAASLIGLAYMYLEMGQYEKAETLNLEAKTILEKILGKEHHEYASCLRQLALLYREMGQYTKAESLYLESKAIMEKSLGKEHIGYAISLDGLAVIYTLLNQYKKAELLYLEAIEITEKVYGKEHPQYGRNLTNLALLYLYMGQHAKAETLFLDAKAIEEMAFGKKHPDYTKTLMNLARLYNEMGQHDKTESYFLQLHSLNKHLIDKAALYLSEEELNNYMKIFSEKRDRTLSFTQNTLRKNLVPICYDNNLFYKGYLLQSTSRIKQLALLNENTADKFNRLKGYQRQLAKQYTQPIAERDSALIIQLEAQANALEKDLTRTVAGYSEAKRQVSWQEVKTALKPGEAALEFVHYQNFYLKATDSIMYAALLLRFEDEQPILIPLFEENQLTAILSAGEEVQSSELLTEIYTRGVTPVINKQIKGLYQLIWQPMDSLLHGIRTIYFSPSGLLHRINFDAVPIGKKETLFDRFRLVRLGSTRSLVVPDLTKKDVVQDALLYGGIQYEMDTTAVARDSAAQETFTTSSTELSFAYADRNVPERGREWNYLPGTEKEVSNIKDLLKKSKFKADVLSGEAATEELFKSIGKGKPSPRILHIATHGFFFPDPSKADHGQLTADGSGAVFKISDHPMIRSGLVLAGGNHAWKTGKPVRPDLEDGILTAYEISQMDLTTTELVVLSACETGLGDIQGNEGVYGLQRAFKIAGAKYLVMSLWQVPDQETSVFMATFYRHWIENNRTIPDAFRTTQQEMRERYVNPYLWAGFVLVE